MVGLGRLERPTSPLSGVRSNHLSYRPEPARKARAPVSVRRKRNEGGFHPANGTRCLAANGSRRVLSDPTASPASQVRIERSSLERR